MRKGIAIMAACTAALLAALLSPSMAFATSGNAMWRLHNPNSGEHFYTASVTERNGLVSVGWRSEGVGWVAPNSGDNVYRLYNPNGGDHHYTTSAGERDALVKLGWRYEGVGWKSGGTVPVYRQYNRNARSGAHNFTPSSEENNSLLAAGWRAEGTAWRAAGTSADYDPSAANAEAHAQYEEIVARTSHVEWYGFLDIDGDGVDEMHLGVYYRPQGGNNRDITLYGYWDGRLRALYSYEAYWIHELHVYPQTLSFADYILGHGGETYSYHRWADGRFSYGASQSRRSIRGGWVGEDGPWVYTIDPNICTQQQFDEIVSGIKRGPCTVYNVDEWMV